MDKESKEKISSFLKKVANDYQFKISNVNIKTNQNPISIAITIKNKDGSDITIEDCAKFNEPVKDAIENSKLFNCAYVLEISSQGVTDELTSDRDFITFKGFPVNVELNQKNSKNKFLKGLLYEKTNDFLAINLKGNIKKIPLHEVLKVNLVTIED